MSSKVRRSGFSASRFACPKGTAKLKARSFILGINLKVASALICALIVGGCQSPSVREPASCLMKEPPETAGEMGSHGFEMRIYPRATDMKRNFTGCQTIWWLAKSGRMQITFKAHFEEGVITSFTGFDDATGENEVMNCRYARRTLVSGETSCPSFKQANRPEGSLPPGCIEKARSADQLGKIDACLGDFDSRN